MARGTFGVFLLHTTIDIQPYRNAYAENIYIAHGYYELMLLVLIIFLGCLAFSIATEWIKAKIFLYKH